MMNNNQTTPPINPMDQSVIQGSPSQSSSKGALVGTIIVILILIAGVIYFVTKQVQAPEAPAQETPTELPASNLSNSDELSAIEADAGATSFSEVEAELQGLEAELAQ